MMHLEFYSRVLAGSQTRRTVAAANGETTSIFLIRSCTGSNVAELNTFADVDGTREMIDVAVGQKKPTSGSPSLFQSFPTALIWKLGFVRAEQRMQRGRKTSQVPPDCASKLDHSTKDMTGKTECKTLSLLRASVVCLSRRSISRFWSRTGDHRGSCNRWADR